MGMLSGVADDSLTSPRERNHERNHCHPGEWPADVVMTADRLRLLCTGFTLYSGQGLVSGRMLRERASFSLSSHARSSEVGEFEVDETWLGTTLLFLLHFCRSTMNQAGKVCQDEDLITSEKTESRDLSAPFSVRMC